MEQPPSRFWITRHLRVFNSQCISNVVFPQHFLLNLKMCSPEKRANPRGQSLHKLLFNEKIYLIPVENGPIDDLPGVCGVRCWVWHISHLLQQGLKLSFKPFTSWTNLLSHGVRHPLVDEIPYTWLWGKNKNSVFCFSDSQIVSLLAMLCRRNESGDCFNFLFLMYKGFFCAYK